MVSSDAVVTDNLYYLQQAFDLVKSLHPAQYIHAHPPVYANGIGPHLRHCLDHYSLFNAGWRDGEVDYDQRPRREEQARDPQAMLAWIGEQSAALQTLRHGDLVRPLQVKMDCGTPMSQPWSASSVFRELQFLVSHTVHHFALVGMILHDQDLPVPPGFGVAPSTLKFEAGSAACAQ